VGGPKAADEKVSQPPNTQATQTDNKPDAKQAVKDEIAKPQQDSVIHRAGKTTKISKEEKRALAVKKTEEKRRVAEEKVIADRKKRAEKEEKQRAKEAKRLAEKSEAAS
jgi:hypothetical protein